jgi:hypothetical protein
MNNDKFRRQIAFEAARLMYERQESEYFRAKLRAAKRICRGWVKPKDLPSNAEIRDQIQHFARLHEGDSRTRNLRDMRIEALEKQVTVNQDKANEIQLEAQPLAVRDWKAYAKQIEEAENYARMALQARNELTRLKKEKDKIIKIQEEHEKGHQHAPNVA